MERYVTVFPIDLATIISGLSLIAAVAAVAVTLYVHFDSARPMVVAYLECDDDARVVTFVVRNFGKSVARNVRIIGFDFERICEDGFRERAERSFIARGIPSLVPDARRSTIVSTTKHVQESLVDSGFRVTVQHMEKSPLRGWRNVSEEFTLDFYSFANAVHTESDTHVIAKSVKKLSEMS